MNNLKYSLAPFAKAWDMLLDIHLPENFDLDDNSDNLASDKVLLHFPIVGACVGIVAYLISWLLLTILGSTTAPYLSAIIIAIGLEFATSGRNLSSFTSFFESKISGHKTPQCLAYLDDDFSVNRNPMGMLIIISSFLFRIFCFSLLIQTGNRSWLIITLILSYGSQGYLASGTDLRSGEPLFDLPFKFTRNIWIVTAVALFIFGLTSLPAPFIALALVIFLSFKFKKYAEGNLGGLTGVIIGFAGYCVELIALLTGIALLVR